MLFSYKFFLAVVSLFYDIAQYFLRFTSAVKAHQFFAEESWDSFKQIFDTYMFEASKVLLYILFLLFIFYFPFWKRVRGGRGVN